ncbi:CAAX protease self-immunity [Nannocystis exedens]|uniref:CAAX protease self-immunity n=1 Tax=Nannocystis exedens TaxID=54 RepID=A0A1I1SXH2_9BACT|nr:CPBP family intramembrane glutamic endopeptidase [Nannocystis exedens]PCC66922.1 CAAX amino terminal protease family protein [Nannocystis exedens]SFD51096.1 CAAX protease self-immunity [Nannocystis exedens]
MARAQPPRPPPPRARSAFWEHFSARIDPFTSAVLVFPLLLVYQLGILGSGGLGLNGVDFVTKSLIELCARDLGNYMAALGAGLLGYAAILVILRSYGRFSPQRFVPMLVESGFYASTMGTLILLVIHRFTELVPGLAVAARTSVADIAVISAGAGLHEELIFRVLGMGGIGFLLSGLTGRRRAWLGALVLSSLIFSLAHHVGPAGEPFTYAAFVYRTLAGVFFALVYQLRGFAVAAWTHALYDVYVLSLHG